MNGETNVVCPDNGLLAIKRNGTQIHAAMCMNLENIMLTEKSQLQKAKSYVILFI